MSAVLWQNDALLRLPSQTSAEASCLPCHGDIHLTRVSASDDGPEQVITADDYVRQRLAEINATRPATQLSDNSPAVVRWRHRRRQTSVSSSSACSSFSFFSINLGKVVTRPFVRIAMCVCICIAFYLELW